ncbi:hypothetical protein OQH61_09260, partial [Helicobacter sp. MIT 21-1697]|uniref:hypothetical protein n=1 Tax=Helicobacter sp. MIT 21-1697 TaxID=2993733 RepID=UPI00224B1329
MFNRFSLGTKIVLCILGIFSLCMIIMVSVLIKQTADSSKENADKLVFNAAKRIANEYEGRISGCFIALHFARQSLSAIIHETSDMDFERRIKNRIEDMLDSNQWLENGFVYIKKNALSSFKIDAKNLINGDMILYAFDEIPESEGGVVFVPADQSLIALSSVQKALKDGQESIGKSREIEYKGQSYNVLDMAMPLFDSKGNIQGVVGMNINLDWVGAQLFGDRFSVFKNDYRWVIDNEARIVQHINKEILFKNLSDLIMGEDAQLIASNVSACESGVYEYNNIYKVDTISGIVSFPIGENNKVCYAISVSAPSDSVYEPIKKVTLSFVVGAIICLFISAVFIVLYMRINVIKRLRT